MRARDANIVPPTFPRRLFRRFGIDARSSLTSSNLDGSGSRPRAAGPRSSRDAERHALYNHVAPTLRRFAASQARADGDADRVGLRPAGARAALQLRPRSACRHVTIRRTRASRTSWPGFYGRPTTLRAEPRYRPHSESVIRAFRDRAAASRRRRRRPAIVTPERPRLLAAGRRPRDAGGACACG